MLTFFDPDWAKALLPFAVAAILSPFIAYLAARRRSRFP
jgi:hypothetical protein